MLFPSLGPFKLFAIQERGFFLADMEHLLTHRDLTFALSKLTGVINFPSFHAVLALTYGYGFYRAGAFGRAMTVLNILMLVSIPFMGGHYLVDVLAGTGVFAVSLAAVIAISRLRPNDRDVFADMPLVADGARAWRRAAD
jgi:membrane-associated phospholipid phosphatase